MMRNDYRKEGYSTLSRGLLTVLLGLFVLSGCEKRDSGDGILFNSIILPTDVVLNLYCEEVGVFPETCVLEDPENPYALVPTFEFNPNNPDGPSKFDLSLEIPAGPTGAKARFYLWATALARQPSGENQWYTARALHELFDANSNPISKDEIVRAQALKAYRSVLSNFFGSAAAFEFDTQILSDQVGKDLFVQEETGFERLVPLPIINVIELFAEWGFRYDQDLEIVTPIRF